MLASVVNSKYFNCSLIVMSLPFSLPFSLRVVFTLLLVLTAATTMAQTRSIDVDPNAIDPSRIEIIRDSYGVPHIFAPTDAEAAYAMAWVQAEDDPETLLKMLAISNGEYGRVVGKDGAVLDFMMKFLAIPDSVDKHYVRDHSPAYQNVMESYCAGVNAYFETHSKQVPRRYRRYFPLTPKALVAGYVFTGVLLNSFPYALQFALQGRADEYLPGYYVLGSNAIAVNNTKTGGEGTFLDVNSHQPTEGVFSWYEVHMNTEEGINMMGGVFPGGINIFHGVSPNLGWAATLNYTDLYDYHRLRMHPKKKHHYRYDGEWLKMKKRKIKLPVKIAFLTLPVRRTVYDTKLGPTVEGEDGHYYAFQVSGPQNVGLGEQLYRMNRATNLSEFKAAMKLKQLSSINFVYADKDDNIYYLHNTNYPVRNNDYNWQGVLPGDTSAVKWTDFIGFEDMIQYDNPSCGYLSNFNHSPFLATCDAENHAPDDYPEWYGAQKLHNNRSLRFRELIAPLETVSWDDFKRIKYDDQYPKRGAFIDSMRALVNRDVRLLPQKLRPMAKHLQDHFDLKADTTNRVFAVVNLALKHLFKKNGVSTRNFETGFSASQADWEEALEFACTASSIAISMAGMTCPMAS